MKKFISLFVAVLMVCSLCVFPVFAAEEAEGKPEDVCIVFGDVDNNGAINAMDARFALRASVKLEEPGEAEALRADTDADGVVKATDARYILRMSVKLEEPLTHVKVIDEAVNATFAVSGKTEGSHCKVCNTVFTAQITGEKCTLIKITDAANEWAKQAGADALIKAEAADGKADIILNVDGIWEDSDIDASVFDGFLTKLGEAVRTYLGDEDTVAIDGNVVFEKGKLRNTAVKTALFDIGAGLFYKIANLKEDGVYGTYAVKVNDENIALTVAFAGSEANLNKVKAFAATIAEHISAEVVDGNLVVDVIAPDALKAYIEEKAGERDVKETLDAITIGGGFAIVESLNIEDVFASQASAVNKLCETVCGLTPFINKVLSKTEAYVELNDGTKVVLNAAEFDCAEDFSFAGFVSGFTGVLSEELLDTTVGAFAVEDYYQVPVHLSVDMSALGLMEGEVITETVYVNIHIF